MQSLLLRPFRFADRQLDRLGMYRVVTLALVFLVVCSLIAALFGFISYTALELCASLAVVTAAGMGSNVLLAKVFGVHTNHESAFITSLIIFFLVLPARWGQLEYSFIIAMVAVLAMLSKYVLVWRKQHILNPVASGAVATALMYAVYPLPPGYFETAWWIGQPVLFVPLVLAAAAVVQKVRKWTPVLAFLSVGFLFFLFEEWRFTGEPFSGWQRFWLSGPSLFLAGFMLTEPFTMPPTKRVQGFYGALVGGISQTTAFLSLGVKMTPELALIFGNIAVYPFRLRRKLFLPLRERREIADSIYEFVFEKPTGLCFAPGQYLEWMLPHEQVDSRGIRRYFTIASSPTESEVRLALKVVESGSSYKQRLMELDAGESIIASQLAGDFLLPQDQSEKLGFIAGGIGVTPFRSHLAYMRDTGAAFDTVLFYCVNTTGELAYRAAFEAYTAEISLQVIPVIANEPVDAPLESGFVTQEMLKRRVPDYVERRWYLSGPPPMVNAYTKLLAEAGVPKHRIVRDFFPGLA